MWNPFESKSYFKLLLLSGTSYKNGTCLNLELILVLNENCYRTHQNFPEDVEKLINSIVCDNALYNQGLKLESTALAPILADLSQVQCTTN